jgi:hypothetical protein
VTTTTDNLFESVVGVTEPYLGPAARRFIVRQVAFHLNKPPETLEAADIPQLVEWTKATLALLTEDKELVDGYARQLMRLGVVG